MINKLTPEKKALIPFYLERWRNIVLSSEPIDRNKAVEIVEYMYSLVGIKTPKIIFCNSPYTAINQMLLDANQEHLQKNITKNAENFVNAQLEDFAKKTCLYKANLIDIQNLNNEEKTDIESLDELDATEENNLDLLGMIFSINQSELVWQFWCKKIEPKGISSFDWFSTAATFDFFTSELDCEYDPKVYQFVDQVVRAGVFIFPFEECCFICDRPTKLLFDNENRFHAEGETAIQFADGQSFYFYHGVTLPEKYGKVHPQQWKPQWLLTETNAELRRILIQGIGYTRICQELQAVELDSWAEYTLLQIDNPIDVEPVYLLKMTCPSTGFIHVLRVPPQTKSAREAIRWVNWGVDPENFSIQT